MITASVVLYNNELNEINELLECVKSSSIEHLYVIDQSSDDSLRLLFDDCQNISYIHQTNKGYGAAHNVAIKKAISNKATYHLVLNPDIKWEGNVVRELANYLDINSEVGLM